MILYDKQDEGGNASASQDELGAMAELLGEHEERLEGLWDFCKDMSDRLDELRAYLQQQVNEKGEDND